MDLGVPEIAVIVVAVLLLFGSLRILRGEMKGMKDDDVRTAELRARAARAAAGD